LKSEKNGSDVRPLLAPFSGGGTEGALADLLLVDGNPIENLELLTEPESKLLVIMKDGKIFKNLTR